MKHTRYCFYLNKYVTPLTLHMFGIVLNALALARGHYIWFVSEGCHCVDHSIGHVDICIMMYMYIHAVV